MSQKLGEDRNKSEPKLRNSPRKIHHLMSKHGKQALESQKNRYTAANPAEDLYSHTLNVLQERFNQKNTDNKWKAE